MENLLGQIRSHLRLTGKRSPDGREIGWCPFHPDGEGDPPHQPNFYLSERGYICHACGAKGGLRELAERLGIDPRAGQTTYVYVNAEGKPLHRIVRLPGIRKTFVVERPDGIGGWVKGLGGIKPVPYRLRELIQAPPGAIIYVVEGEKDADRLASQGFIATTNPFGAGKWRKHFSRYLRGRDVIILPDNDDLGRKHASDVAYSLLGIAQNVKILELEGLPEKGDVSDWLSLGHGPRELMDLSRTAANWNGDGGGKAPAPETSTRRPDGGSTKDLVRFVLDQGVELFHDQFEVAHARIPKDHHWEILPVGGAGFRRWVNLQYYHMERRSLTGERTKGLLEVLEGMATYENPRYELHTRVAAKDGEIWYDLTDEEWRCIRITKEGWEIVNDPPVLFRRMPHQTSQTEPTRGGSIDAVFEFLPRGLKEYRGLLLPYLVTCFAPEIPHPILILLGPHGACKTSVSRILKALIDPSILKTLSFGGKQEGLVQQLSHHWYAPYDNLSSLPDWALDSFCRAVTGEGNSKRSHYTNDDDFLYTYRRCVALNSIAGVAQRADIQDRSILIRLEQMSPENRRAEEGLWAAFQLQKPALLGACFTALSRTLALLPTLKMVELPRMADFALGGTAAAEALGIGKQAFQIAYATDEEVRNHELLADDPLGDAILHLLDTRGEWHGRACNLHVELRNRAFQDGIDTRDSRWPKGANRLTARLNELRKSFQAAGVDYNSCRDRRGSRIVLRRNAMWTGDDAWGGSSRGPSHVQA